MSIKFRKDCPVYPTSAKDEILTIHFGTGIMEMPFPFSDEEFPMSCEYFAPSGIMCYLNNGNTKVVMRFDGSVTKFNKDNVVIGMGKFDRQNIYSKLVTLPVGCVFTGTQGNRQAHDCYIRILKDSDICMFECTNDPSPIQFDATANPQFCSEVARGTRIFPALIKLDEHRYADEQLAYEIIGNPILYDSFVSI